MAVLHKVLSKFNSSSVIRVGIPLITTSNLILVNEGEVDCGLIGVEDPNNLPTELEIWSGVDAQMFEIDEFGHLVFTSITPDYDDPLDADKDNDYKVILRVSNNNNRYSFKAITVRIQNVVEIPGDILLSSNTVDENEVIGTKVGDLSAVGMVAPVVFTLVSGDGDRDNGLFSIVGDELFTDSVFNFESINPKTIRVKAVDSENNEVEVVFPILVSNVIEAPTGLFISQNNIMELLPIGSTVATLSYTHQEINPPAPVYSLVLGYGDNDQFTITGNSLKSGAIYNYETKNVYDIKLSVSTDGGNTSYEKVFTIYILNVNESPSILSASTFNVSEGTLYVGKVTAVDPEYDEITYSIDRSNPANKFTIDPVTGIINFIAVADYETPGGIGGTNTYNIIVKATDPSGLYASQSIIVNVLDISENEIYVKSDGLSTNNGTILNPVTFARAIEMAIPGSTIYVMDDIVLNTIHRIEKSGMSNAPIRLYNYPGTRPKITPSETYFSATSTTGTMFRNCSWWDVQGIDFTEFQQPSFLGNNIVAGLWLENVNDSIFKNLRVYRNGMGFYMKGDSGNNLIENCDFFENKDPYTSSSGSAPYGNADGLDIAFITGAALNKTNIVIGCRAWLNSDDGFDNYNNNGIVIYENCWALKNGFIDWTTPVIGNGNGFKFGPSAYTTNYRRNVTRCIAAGNRTSGFETNQGLAGHYMVHNLAYNNGSGLGAPYWPMGFKFSDNSTPAVKLRNTFINNIALLNTNQEFYGCRSDLDITLAENWTLITNTFTLPYNNTGVFPGQAVANADFEGTVDVGVIDFSEMIGPRKSDGSLPDITCFKLKSTSALKNSGTYIGLPYSGTAPSLGPFELDESGGSNEPPNITSSTTKIIYAGDTIIDDIVANDPELDEITLTISGNEDEDFFEIVNGNRLQLKSPAIFDPPKDFDADNVYFVDVTATDSKGASSTKTFEITLLPEIAPLEIQFNSNENATIWLQSLVPGGSISNVADWNTAFKLPANGTPFTSVVIESTLISLWGATSIKIENLLFYQNANIVLFRDNGYCITEVGNSVHYQNTSLVSARYPRAKTFKESIFRSCISLIDLDVHNGETFGTSCFNNCPGIGSITAPGLLTTGDYCFRDCTGITEHNYPVLTKAGRGSYWNNVLCTIYYMPECDELGNSVLDEGGNYTMWGNLSGKTATVTVKASLATCNGGNPDGDIQTFLAANPASTVVYV